MNFGNWFVGNAIGSMANGAGQGLREANTDEQKRQQWQKIYELQKQGADQSATEFKQRQAAVAADAAFAKWQAEQASQPTTQAQPDLAQPSVPIPATGGPVNTAPTAPTTTAPTSPIPTSPWDASMAKPSVAPGWRIPPAAAAPPPAPATNPSIVDPTSESAFHRTRLNDIDTKLTSLSSYMKQQAAQVAANGGDANAFMSRAGEHLNKLNEVKIATEEKLAGAEISDNRDAIATGLALGLPGTEILSQIDPKGNKLSPATQHALASATPATKKIGGTPVAGYMVLTPKGQPSFIPTGAAVALLGTKDIKAWTQATQFYANLDSDYTKSLSSVGRANQTEADKEKWAMAAGEAVTILQNNGGNFKELSPIQAAAVTMVPGAGNLFTKGQAADAKTLKDLADLKLKFSGDVQKAKADAEKNGENPTDEVGRIGFAYEQTTHRPMTDLGIAIAETQVEPGFFSWDKTPKTVKTLVSVPPTDFASTPATPTPWKVAPTGPRPTAPGGMDAAVADARMAILKGADRTQVLGRLRAMGYQGDL